MTSPTAPAQAAMAAPDSRARDVVGGELRSAMRRHAAAVWIATTTAPDSTPTGLTVSSFTSISLNPPLVGFFVGTTSRTLTAWRVDGPAGVHLLDASQTRLAERFAAPSTERFNGVNWRTGPSGAPLLSTAAVCMQGRVDALIELGDHHLIVAEITHIDAADEQHTFPPLVHHARAFGTVTTLA